MSLSPFGIALKTAIAVDEYKQETIIKKEQNEKKWNPNVLVKGGVSYVEIVDQKIVEKDGVKKLKPTKKKVKITVILQGHDNTEYTNKAKFSFRNGLGNRVFMNVKTYIDADKVIRAMYESKESDKTPYLITVIVV